MQGGERLTAMAVEPWPGAPEQMGSLLRNEVVRYGEIIRSADLPRD